MNSLRPNGGAPYRFTAVCAKESGQLLAPLPGFEFYGIARQHQARSEQDGKND